MDSTPDLVQWQRDFGVEALSFQTLAAGMRYFVDPAAPQEARAVVAYVDTGSAWIAAGAPMGLPAHVHAAAERFVLAARVAGRRACFFGTETAMPARGFSRLLLGEQPWFIRAQWPATLARHRRLREQLRRARAKGVTTRRVEGQELAAGTPLRRALETLAEEWLGDRHMEPLGFVAGTGLLRLPAKHCYVLAERDGRLVAALSAVPIPARGAWLVEHVLRRRDTPNGTAELLLDALMRELPEDASVTLGLAPLGGPVAVPLRLARRLSRPLYDFRGLRAFRERLHPQSWQRVWLEYPRRQSRVLTVLDVLRAFSGGSLVRFGARSLARHPSGSPWLLALSLLPWTVVLASLALCGEIASQRWLGFSRASLAGWVLTDAALAAWLFQVARRPRLGPLLVATALCALDAVGSALHLVQAGLGGSALPAALRLVSALGPAIAAITLGVAASRVGARSRARPSTPPAAG